MDEQALGIEPASPGPAVISGRAECRRHLSARHLVSDPALAGLPPDASSNMLFMDDEVHQRLRALVLPHLTRPRVDQLREHLDALSRSLVSEAMQKPDTDLVADVAEPLALAGILMAMQVPPARWAELGDLARKMIGLLEPDLPPDARRVTAKAILRAMMLFERDAASGQACGLHGDLEAAAVRGLIPVKLARSTPIVLLHGGYENPLNQLSCIIASAVSDPVRFKQAASMAPTILVEEILRTYSPARLVRRWAASDSADTGDDGTSYRRGDIVLIDLESASAASRPFATTGPPLIDVSQKRSHLHADGIRP